MTDRATPGAEGSPEPRAGKAAEEGAQGPRESVWGGERGPGGARWVWGRRAHLPPVSAAIAGHMTEAVAGMTAWALATRGGGTREGGGGCAGVRTEGKGGDCTLPAGSHCLL